MDKNGSWRHEPWVGEGLILLNLLRGTLSKIKNRVIISLQVFQAKSYY